MADFFYPSNLVILAPSISRGPLEEYSHHLVLGLQPISCTGMLITIGITVQTVCTPLMGGRGAAAPRGYLMHLSSGFCSMPHPGPAHLLSFPHHLSRQLGTWFLMRSHICEMPYLVLGGRNTPFLCVLASLCNATVEYWRKKLIHYKQKFL